MNLKTFLVGLTIGVFFSVVTSLTVLYKLSSLPVLSLEKLTFVKASTEAQAVDDYEGKVVVLNIWATWCAPCIKEMPGIQNAINRFDHDKVLFIVASDEDTTRIRKFRARRNLTMDLYNFGKADPGVSITNSRPATYIFDKNGKMVYGRVGAFDWSGEDFNSKLNSLLR